MGRQVKLDRVDHLAFQGPQVLLEVLACRGRLEQLDYREHLDR